jgi:hypothetical protein
VRTGLVAVVLTVPGTRTVTVVRRVRRKNDDGTWARDSRGNAIYDEEHIEVHGCSVQPATSTEQNDQQRVLVTSLVTIYAPLTWPAMSPEDAVLIDGRRYEVQGKPQRWEHPRLGHVVVTVQEASG